MTKWMGLQGFCSCYEDTDSLDYYGGARYAAKPHYWFSHTLSDIVTACLENGMALEHLREYPSNCSSAAFDALESNPARVPLSFTLVARRV